MSSNSLCKVDLPKGRSSMLSVPSVATINGGRHTPGLFLSASFDSSSCFAVACFVVMGLLGQVKQLHIV